MRVNASRFELPALALLCACAAPSRPPAGAEGVPAEAREKEARRLAPDLYLLAERARGEARESRRLGKREVALDRDTRARLLLDAALTEAERIKLERRAARAAQRAERALTEAARQERERRKIEQESRLLEAARIARLEAERVFEQTAAGRAASGRTAAARGRKRASASAGRDRDFVLGRARLILAAAISMSASNGPVRNAERAIRQAEAGDGSDRAALARALKALAAAENALQDARANSPAVADR